MDSGQNNYAENWENLFLNLNLENILTHTIQGPGLFSDDAEDSFYKHF